MILLIIANSSTFYLIFAGSLDNVTINSESMSSKEKEDFWQSLQDEWEKMAREDELEEHPWLSEFKSASLDPFKVC